MEILPISFKDSRPPAALRPAGSLQKIRRVGSSRRVSIDGLYLDLSALAIRPDKGQA
jgi:hypothetical protein